MLEKYLNGLSDNIENGKLSNIIGRLQTITCLSDFQNNIELFSAFQKYLSKKNNR